MVRWLVSLGHWASIYCFSFIDNTVYLYDINCFIVESTLEVRLSSISCRPPSPYRHNRKYTTVPTNPEVSTQLTITAHWWCHICWTTLTSCPDVCTKINQRRPAFTPTKTTAAIFCPAPVVSLTLVLWWWIHWGGDRCWNLK